MTTRTKGIYIGAPGCFALQSICLELHEAFCESDDDGFSGGIYVVGSCLERPDWRDVDVRMILSDRAFQQLFPCAEMRSAAWEHDPRWLVLTVAISERMSKVTGLPIDFQIQPQTHANERHPGLRHAIGFRVRKEAQSLDSASGDDGLAPQGNDAPQSGSKDLQPGAE